MLQKDLLLGAAYIGISLALTLSSKAMFGAWKFPHPFVITLLHMVFSHLGSAAFLLASGRRSTRMTSARIRRLAIYSVLFCLNIVMSNWSLKLLPVSMHQTMGTLTPLATMATSVAVLAYAYTWKHYACMFAIVLSAVLATAGEMDANTAGMLVALVTCCVSAGKSVASKLLLGSGTTVPRAAVAVVALHVRVDTDKTIGADRSVLSTTTVTEIDDGNGDDKHDGTQVSGAEQKDADRGEGEEEEEERKRLLDEEKLHPLEFINWMTVFAVIELSVMGFLYGDFDFSWREAIFEQPGFMLTLALNGALAFGVNFSNFLLTKQTTPIIVNVCGILKNMLTVVCGVLFFDNSMSPRNTVGTVLVFVFAALYRFLPNPTTPLAPKVTSTTVTTVVK
jgi:drug/metabolite transporter (DMT)-like permease